VLLQTNDVSDVLDAMHDVCNVLVQVEYRRVDGAPVALLEGTTFALRQTNEVPLDCHHVRCGASEYSFQRLV
jgi:hypothetical protein